MELPEYTLQAKSPFPIRTKLLEETKRVKTDGWNRTVYRRNGFRFVL